MLRNLASRADLRGCLRHQQIVRRIHRLGAMVIVSLTMGLRISEASGLSWVAVDLNTRTLRVERQLQALGKGSGLTLAPLKTRDTLTLPTLAVKALKAHRKAQLAERLRAGAEWKNEADLVFTMPNGRPLRPKNVRGVLSELLTAAGRPQVRYHAQSHRGHLAATQRHAAV